MSQSATSSYAPRYDPLATLRRDVEQLRAAGAHEPAQERLRDAACSYALRAAHEIAADLFLEAASFGASESAGDALRTLGLLQLVSIDSEPARSRAMSLADELEARAVLRNDPIAHARLLVLRTTEALDTVEAVQRAALLQGGGWSERALAYVAAISGRHEDACLHHETALAWANEHGDRLLEARTLEAFAAALGWLGKVDESFDLLQHAASTCLRVGDVARAASCHLAAAEQCLLAGRIEQAHACIEDASRCNAPRFALLELTQRLRIALFAGDGQASRDIADHLDQQLDDARSCTETAFAVVRRLQAALVHGELVLAEQLLIRARTEFDATSLDTINAELRLFELELSFANGEASLGDTSAAMGSVADEMGDPTIQVDAALWSAWHAMLQQDDDVLEAARRRAAETAFEDGDVLYALARRVTVAFHAARVDGDDRGVRSCLRAARAHGFGDLELKLLVALDRDKPASLAAHVAELERRELVRDVDDVSAILPRDVVEIPPAIRSLASAAPTDVARQLLDSSSRNTIRAGTRIEFAARESLLVVDGLLHRLDADEMLEAVIGPGAVVRESERELMAAGEVVVWRLPAALVGEPLDLGIHVLVERRSDARRPVLQRVAQVIIELASLAGEAQLTQEQLAELAATSRKSASLAVSELRRAGAANLARRRLHVLDAERLASVARGGH